jgi:hypothetical protein
MNNKRLTWMSLIVILVLVLTACARAEVIEDTPEPPVVEQPATDVPTSTEEPTATDPPAVEPTEVEETEEPTVTPTEATDDEDERMQALISEKIGGCHMLNFILRQTKTAEEWSVTIDRMIGKGANVNAEEKELIIDYLVSRQQ